MEDFFLREHNILNILKKIKTTRFQHKVNYNRMLRKSKSLNVKTDATVKSTSRHKSRYCRKNKIKQSISFLKICYFVNEKVEQYSTQVADIFLTFFSLLLYLNFFFIIVEVNCLFCAQALLISINYYSLRNHRVNF